MVLPGELVPEGLGDILGDKRVFGEDVGHGLGHGGEEEEDDREEEHTLKQEQLEERASLATPPHQGGSDVVTRFCKSYPLWLQGQNTVTKFQLIQVTFRPFFVGFCLFFCGVPTPKWPETPSKAL